jgi:hypothetical protein
VPCAVLYPNTHSQVAHREVQRLRYALLSAVPFLTGRAHGGISEGLARQRAVVFGTVRSDYRTPATASAQR